MTIFNKLLMSICSIVICSFLIGCGGSDSNPDGGISGTGDSLFKSPTDASLDFDLELTSVASSGKKLKLARSDHFSQVTSVTDVLSQGVRSKMQLPFKLLKKALSVDPVKGTNDKQLIWSYDETVGDVLQSIKLEGELFGEQIFWKMMYSQTDLLLMKGVSHIKGEKGFWDILDESGEIVATINWKVVEDSSKLSIQNLKSGSIEFGNSIEFAKEGDDISVVYYRLNRDHMVEMFWNKSTGIGGIRDEELNGGELSAWDTTGEDVDVVNAPSFDLVLPPKNSILFNNIKVALSSVNVSGESNFQQGIKVGQTIDTKIHDKLNGMSLILSDAQSVSPVDTGFGSFTWTYSGSMALNSNVNYFAELEGIPAGEQVRWKLKVSLIDGNEKNLVMHGFTNKDSTNGVWQIENIFDFIKTAIVWSQDDNRKQIVYRHINLLDKNKGDFLRSIRQDGDISFEYYNHATNNLLRLKFNTTKLNGLVEDPGYQNGDAYAWDTSFLNID